MDEAGHPQSEDDYYFDTTQESRRVRRDANAEIGQSPHQHGGSQGKEPPGKRDAGAVLQEARCRVAEVTDGPCRPEDIIDQVAPGREEPAAGSEATRYKGVIAAAGWHVARKLRDRVGNNKAHDNCKGERNRHRRPRSACDHWQDKDDTECRADVTDALEDHVAQSK